MTDENEQKQELEQEGEEGGEEEGGEGKGKRGPDGWIPKVRFNEVIGKVHGLEQTLQQEREARIRLEEQLKARAPDKPERYTKQQLREMVATGQMTQDQADDTWDAQREAEITEKVMGAVKSTSVETATLTRVNSDLARYKELAPDILVEGSETRQAVAERYQYLLSIGAPRGAATELAAANAVLGPVEALERKAKGRTVTQSHEESGGGGKGNDGGKGGKKSLLDQAPERYKSHYENMIAKGLTTREQAEKELARMGIGKLNERAKRYG